MEPNENFSKCKSVNRQPTLLSGLATPAVNCGNGPVSMALRSQRYEETTRRFAPGADVAQDYLGGLGSDHGEGWTFLESLVRRLRSGPAGRRSGNDMDECDFRVAAGDAGR